MGVSESHSVVEHDGELKEKESLWIYYICLLFATHAYLHIHL